MPRAENGIKICNKCKCAKQVIDFHKDKNRKDGLMQICITCKREYRISPFYKAREKELEKTQEYKDRKKRYNKTLLGKCMDAREKHKKNGHVGLSHTLTLDQWGMIIVNQGNKCAVCQGNFYSDNPVTRDCIIPLSKGGALTFENTQALCFSCNAKKHTKMYSGLLNAWRGKR